ncbi:MAG: GlsB/YeaQ/YmgE family stress response membrane protein [bacterium]|nr:GlsB/YeaQ/YmgE family stress response membrane protein [bacterium]
MNVLLWIILGGLAGWIASAIMGSGRQSILADVILGILGAIVGGFIMSLFGQPAVSGFSIYSLVVAVIGAAVLIYAGRLLRS